MTVESSALLLNLYSYFQGHVLSRDASRSRGRQKMTFGMMDLEQFKVALGELLGIPSWEVNSMSSLSEQAEMLFRKVHSSFLY